MEAFLIKHKKNAHFKAFFQLDGANYRMPFIYAEGCKTMSKCAILCCFLLWFSGNVAKNVATKMAAVTGTFSNKKGQV